MDGRPLAARVRAEVAEDVRELGHIGLATVLVGDDEASHRYIGSKQKAAREAGIDAIDHRLPATADEEEVLSLVASLSADDGIDAILVQLPLPDGIDEARVISAVEPGKDVDGFHPVNAGLLYLGRPHLVPATPLGIVALLAEYEVPLEGARAVVVGRSDIVGKPIAHLLLQADATVTVCHSRTAELERHTREADVLVVAAGRARLVRSDMVKAGAAVVDVGQNRTEAGLAGDVDPAVAEVAGLLTPVPGGVGPMTVAMLLRNAVTAAKSRRRRLAFPQG